jgi:hypothetical protein
MPTTRPEVKQYWEADQNGEVLFVSGGFAFVKDARLTTHTPIKIKKGDAVTTAGKCVIEFTTSDSS